MTDAAKLAERLAALLNVTDGEWLIAINVRDGRVRRIVPHHAPTGRHDRERAYGRDELEQLVEHDERAA